VTAASGSETTHGLAASSYRAARQPRSRLASWALQHDGHSCNLAHSTVQRKGAIRFQAPVRGGQYDSPPVDFETVADAVSGIPYLSREHGKSLYDHIIAEGSRDVLEIGTAHGVSAAYMAAAAQENRGKVTTVDTAKVVPDPSPESVFARAGLQSAVEIVRVEDSSYTWWLKKQVEQASDQQGNCEPKYDFCYLDGAHNWTIDGLAAVLVEKLLRPGGWLLLDDLNWSYGAYGGRYGGPGQSPQDLGLSDSERESPHVRAVFELLVKQNPNFTEFRVEDTNWAWAHKAPGQPRRYELEVSKPLSALVLQFLVTGRRRLQQRKNAS
jgi:predicted O-methyltransferase YrrM